MKYLKYLHYVLRHRWFVFWECAKRGLLWRGLVHDLSKFRPSEFIPYAEYFYGSISPKRDYTGYYDAMRTGDPAFTFAWFLHQKRNDHHWQYWMGIQSDGTVDPLEMPDAARKEMMADWFGAGRAQGTPDVQLWWTEHKNDMILHRCTRQMIEEELGLS